MRMRCRQMSERRMIALWMNCGGFIPERALLQN